MADKLARRPSGVPRATIKKLGILGNGAAEAQFVDVAATAGIQAVLLDGIPTESDPSPGGYDLLAKILLPVDLPVAWHASRQQGADFIGIHLAGAAQVQVMEIVVDTGADEHAVAHAFDLARQLRHTPVPIHGASGLYTHRLRTAYVDEGMCLLAEGVMPALIENAAAAAGMAQGPLACADDMPLEMHWRLIRDIVEGGMESTRSLSAYHVGKRMVQRFLRLGRAVGAGFYDHPEQGTKILWPGLKDVFPPKESQPDVEQVKTRLLYIQALEAARCIEEGLIRHVADADLAGSPI